MQNYATFTGRARRSEYWYFALFNMIVSFVISFIGGITDFIFLGNIYSIAVLIPSLAVGVRRMHDVGKSGWFLLIPFYNFVLSVTDGEKGDNKYGSDPKNEKV